MDQQNKNKKVIYSGTKEYDDLVKKFVNGGISFEDFCSSTPSIPPPPAYIAKKKSKLKWFAPFVLFAVAMYSFVKGGK